MQIANKTHNSIISKIRELWMRSGATHLGTPCYWDKNDITKYIGIEFDYGYPMTLCTPEGAYRIIGGSVNGDYEQFWALLNETFVVEIVKPKRDDKITSYFKCQTLCSGPVVKLSEKSDVFEWEV